MPNFCPNCGKDITEKVKFCPECGVDIDSFLVKKDEKSIVEENKTDIKIEDSKIEDKKIKRKYSIWDMVSYGIILVGIIIILLIAIAFSAGMNAGMTGSQSQYSTPTQAPSSRNIFAPTPTESPTQRNTRIAKEIVADYHKSHTYYGKDIFVCGDMANDVWDILKTNGINAKIAIGDVEKDISKITDANHAWVLAEVAPDTWLALETTGGYAVYKTDNPRYYTGQFFYSPKQFKTYTQLLQGYNDAVTKYNLALSDYNNFVNQYNNANFLTKLAWKGQLDDKKLILNQRIQDLNDINQQISALLSSL